VTNPKISRMDKKIAKIKKAKTKNNFLKKIKMVNLIMNM
jgi:hypothetical protein